MKNSRCLASVASAAEQLKPQASCENPTPRIWEFFSYLRKAQRQPKKTSHPSPHPLHKGQCSELLQSNGSGEWDVALPDTETTSPGAHIQHLPRTVNPTSHPGALLSPPWLSKATFREALLALTMELFKNLTKSILCIFAKMFASWHRPTCYFCKKDVLYILLFVYISTISLNLLC